MAVSIIIPTWNEATCLGRTLSLLQSLSPPPQEIVLVDGGSTDRTVAIAQSYRDRLPLTVLQAPAPGRSIQMNLGAAAAQGDLLCFLHADTLVPDDLVLLVQSTLDNPTVAGGGFISLMTGPRTIRWAISLHNAVKTYYAPLLFRPYLFFFAGCGCCLATRSCFAAGPTFWPAAALTPPCQSWKKPTCASNSAAGAVFARSIESCSPPIAGSPPGASSRPTPFI